MNFVSNTLASLANQNFFYSDGKVQKARIYIKIFRGGKYEYIISYNNTIDSTYADGKHSSCNKILKSWEILSLRAGKVSYSDMKVASEPSFFTDVLFSGNKSVTLPEGGAVTSDTFIFEAEKDEYMCIEITYKGEEIPCHSEVSVPAFYLENEKWIAADSIELNRAKVPVPSFVGCNREVNKKIAYLGDSITQGIGADKNSYLHWTAVLSELIGEENAYRNLGIGYARSSDAASNGAWLSKVKENDIVFLCLGVNDILRGGTKESVSANLEKIVTILKKEGIKVIIQSVPPFDYPEDIIETWNYINSYIENKIVPLCDGYFDNRTVLSKSIEESHKTLYGGHPNNEGGQKWGKALYEYVKSEFIM